MRTKSVEPEQILDATIRLVAQDGLENLSTRKIARETGVSDGYIFNYFENKNDLLVKCLYHIDNAIDNELSRCRLDLLQLKKSIRNLWYAYFNYLLAHPEQAKFYRQFRLSSYYTDEVIKGQDKSFSFFKKMIILAAPSFQINMDIFWVYMIETTLNFSIRCADKQLPCEERDKEKYFGLLANGIGGIIKSTKDWK